MCWALQPWQSSRALWSYLVNSCHEMVMILAFGDVRFGVMMNWKFDLPNYLHIPA